MSSIKKPAERLLNLFVPLMERPGYAYRRSGHRFQRAFRHGTFEYCLQFDGRGGFVGVDAGVFVHFEALERQFENALGYACPWSAGAMLLNAGANPWKFWLNEDRYATMSPKERSAIPSDVIHPQWRIQASVDFLMEAHAQFAEPLFQRLQTYRQLADFYLEYIRNGFSGRCRPFPENVIYLSLLVGASLGDDLEEIVAAANAIRSNVLGHDVNAKVQVIKKYIDATDLKSLLSP
jgi:hypothetical protein